MGRYKRVDSVSAGLIDARFDRGGDEHGVFLRGEREAQDDLRTLLGKPARCHGRERELTTLLLTFDECVSDSDECVSDSVARTVLVTGPAGAGKPRVRYELSSRLREPEVWLVRADSAGAG